VTLPTCSVEETVRLIVRLLVERDYEGLGRLLTAPAGLDVGDYIRRAVERYGAEVCMPPDDEALRDSIRTLEYVPGADPPAWLLDIDLWTVQDGRSDLTLQVTLTDSGSTICTVDFEDLHVM
jgi:hypothetical protein